MVADRREGPEPPSSEKSQVPKKWLLKKLELGRLKV